MLICKFCAKECKNNNSLINHQRLCVNNPNRQISNLVKREGKVRKKPIRPPCSEATKEKLRISSARFKHSDETKLKMSEAKKYLYASGWEPTCGRCKKYRYVSKVAGDISVDGTWELIVAKYLDFIGVKWNRNTKRFKYIKPDGRESTYQPDFFIESWDTFLEVKGYETELDRCKWTQFEFPLLIWKKEDIKNLEDKLVGN